MKLWKTSICFACIAILLLSCSTALATTVNDGTGDVWHYSQAGTAWSWVGNVGNKPNIDITEVSYSVNEGKVTISLQVAGTIQSSDKIGYWVYFNTTDSQYWLWYSNGNGSGFGMKGMNWTTENVTISGGRLSVVLDVIGDTTKMELWGWAAEYTTAIGDAVNEWWGDWAPNDRFTGTPDTSGNTDTDGNDGTNGNQSSDDTTGKKGTPGFEVILCLAAVAVALLILRRRR